MENTSISTYGKIILYLQFAEEEAPTFVGILKDVSLRKPLIAAIVLTVSQQISGINAVFYYSTTFFEVSIICCRKAKPLQL